MKDYIKAIKSIEVQRKATETVLGIVDIFYSGVTNPTQPINPSSLAKLGQNMTEVFYTYKNEFINIKLIAFFSEAEKKLNQNEINSFLNKLDQDQEKFLEEILAMLDRLEQKEKATLLGKIFTSCVKGKISISEYKQVFRAVDRIYLETLESIRKKEFQTTTYEFKMLAQQMFAVGLMVEEVEYPATFDNITPIHHYTLTALGSILFEIGFDDPHFNFHKIKK